MTELKVVALEVGGLRPLARLTPLSRRDPSMTSSGLGRRSAAATAPLFRPIAGLLAGALALAACQGPTPAMREADIPAGRTLVRDGLAPGGDLIVVVDDAPEACRALQLWGRQAGHWRQIVAGPPLTGPACPSVTARLSPDARLVAVYDYGAGRATLTRLAEDGLAPVGVAAVGARHGYPFPPPGPNLAFSADASRLLLGAPNRDCRRLPESGTGCGTAELLERRGDAWQVLAMFQPPADEDGRARFGQAVALGLDGALAVVGGTGEAGRSGGLWVFAVTSGEPRLVQLLSPRRADGWYAKEVALSGDGRWLAVGADQAVYLYQRDGEGFSLRKRLDAPDPNAGQFGETLALSHDGGTLLVGAPRASCAAGERCGIAYLYTYDRFWRLADTILPATNRADANFAHHAALSADGRHLAAQGAMLHVFTRGAGAGGP
jgi:hypothetical protein